MNTATKITLVRILLIPVFMVCMYFSMQVDALHYVALVVFAAASLTDFIDGHIARKYHQITDLGKFLDPLADKVLVLSAMAMLCEWHVFPAWALMIVITREFAVSGLRMVAASNGRVIAAAWSGKIKTAATMSGLCIMLLLQGNFFGNLLGESAVQVINWVIVGLISVTTLWSGVEYFVRNRDVFRK